MLPIVLFGAMSGRFILLLTIRARRVLRLLAAFLTDGEETKPKPAVHRVAKESAMYLRKAAFAIGLACALGACGAASQTTGTTQVASARCGALSDVERQVADLYADGHVQRVEPLYRQQFVARAIQPRYVAGAKLYVPAEQGWSQPYLERVLSCHAASQATLHPNDPLRVDNIASIDVATAGAHFVVTVAGADRTAGKEIWQRARALQAPSSNVDVRQLSALGQPSAL
jgi:hypothetical protein